MSAVIDITSHRQRRAAARTSVVQPDTDDLVAELAEAVGASRDRWVGTPDGPRRLLDIRPDGVAVDRQGGSNDLVVVATGDDVRRRRLVIGMVTMALAMVLALFAGLGGAIADGTPEVAGSTTLQAGETLWQVADEITPAGQDVRPNLDAIMTLNDFDSATLPAGTLVLLPDGG